MRFHYRSSIAAIVLALLVLVARPAGASILGTYNDRGTWEGLTSNRTDIDFSSLGLNPGQYTFYNSAAGLTIGGATFVGRAQSDSIFELLALHAPANAPEDWGSGALLRGPSWYAGSYLQITFASGITSFGLDLMSMTPEGAAFRVLVDGVDIGGTDITTANRPNRTFFGLQSDIAFTQIRILLATGTVNSTQGLFDNISYGDVGGGGGPEPPPGETPEATTLLYAASGIGLMYWARKRRLLIPTAV